MNYCYLLSCMVIVSRFHEVNGLEQNPKIIKKLNSNIDSFNNKISCALNIILEEGVYPLNKGNKWFKYESDRFNLNPEKT